MTAAPPAADDPRRTLRIIWGALCYAVVLYAAITGFIHPTGKPVASIVNMVVTILGVSTVVLGAVFYRLTIGRAADNATARHRMSGAQQHALAATVQSQAIAVMSFLEAPAVFSVMLHFMGGPQQAVRALQACSLVALMVFRAAAMPRLDALMRAPSP